MKAKKFLAAALAGLMTVSMLPLSAMAATVDYDISKSGCDFYNVIEKNDYALAPGATESEIVVNDDTGSNRNVLHVIEVDLTNDNISVMPTYMGIEEGIDFEDSSNWGSQTLTKQAAHVENDLGLNVVGGINTCLRYTSDHPYGVLVWNGVVYSDERNASGVSTAQTFLSVTKDGKASLHSASEPIPDDCYNAISANFGWIVKDGVSQYTSANHSTDAAPRTVIGIKATGELVLMMNDGRQVPYSKGMSMHECADMLLAMGCVDAVNCDGGGSSTFISEREGTGELTMKSSPSDGGERATLGGLLVVSKAVADGKFDHATVKSSESYVTPGSTVNFTATGADSAGGPAEIPADVTWQLEDSSMGKVENGVFTSSGKTGTAVVQMVYNGEVVGEDSVNVVIPESIAFSQENITVPYGKVVDIEIKATINNGLNEVVIKDGDVVLELSDSKLGSVENLVYTACGEDAGVSTGTVTATLVFDKSKTAVANLNLGRGSEIFWDFEDGDISSLSIGTGYSSKHPAHPELGRFESGYIEVVDSTTGQVKNGDKALAVVCDWSNFYAMGYNMLRLSGLDIDLTDALRVGFWIYLTPEATGVELDFENWYEFNHGDAGSDAYPEDGWYYVSVDASKISKSTFNNLNIYQTDGYDTATNENIPNIKTKHTIYIDDITVDYSTAVEDREAPTFTSVNVLKDADTYEAMKGQTVTNSTVTVMAEAKEDTAKNNYTGLDMSSAKVYVDGVQLTEGISCANNGSISVDNLQLSDGTHTFCFEISDNAGNARSVTRQIVVDTTENVPEIALVPHDATLDKLPIGSMYWMDLQVSNIENIDTVSTVIDLDGMNDWQLDYMEVADGFSAEYTVDDHTNNATITIKRTESTNATGQAVLVSIPIHIWEYVLCEEHPDCINDGKGVCNFVSTPAQMWSGDGQFRIALCINVDFGKVTFTDGTTDTFSSENYVIDTELDKHRNIITQTEKEEKTSWHIHVPVAVDDKNATCTENGYTGRTVCVGCACGNTADDPCDSFDGCGSVVDWGTVIPATGHTYKYVDGQLVCEDCGDVDTDYSGYFESENGWVYFLEGKAVTGWINLDDGWHYFKADGTAAVGTETIDGLEYSFEGEKGKSIGAWKVTDEGVMYYYCHRYYKQTWATIDGEKYYFDHKGYYQTGITTIGTEAYEFAEDGKLVAPMNGVFYEPTYGYYAYAIDGKMQYDTGLIKWENNYYYVRENGRLITWATYVSEEKANGLLTAGNYTFGEDGKLIMRNGVATDDYGKLCYYINGVQQFNTGLVKWGDDYYYVRPNGLILTWPSYVSEEKANGLLPAGDYSF